MKKNRTKIVSRIISIIVSLVMLFSMLPAMTFAADPGLTFDFLGGSYTYSDGVLNITQSGIYAIRNHDANNAHSDRIVISAPSGDVKLTLKGVNIDVSGTTESPFEITGDCSVNIILLDGSKNILKAGTGHAALENNSHSLTISCAHTDEEAHYYCNGNCGSLTATGGENGAGIGGGENETGENITIKGGNITAIGGSQSAGIGGGKTGVGNNITISKGVVNATGGLMGAGIGGGHGAGTNINISGGTVNATGGSYSAGIGGGYNNVGSNINFSGGSVTANGGIYAAGIGGGYMGNSSDITFSGGSVTANCGLSGYGAIGGSGVSATTTNVKVKPSGDFYSIVKTSDGEEKFTTEQDICSKISNKKSITIVTDKDKTLNITGDDGYIYEYGILNITEAGSYTIANIDKKQAHGNKIIVSAPSGIVDITLDGVIINISSTDDTPFNITGNCSVNITLKDGSDNHFDAGSNRAGIENNTHHLTISCAHATEPDHICGEKCGSLRAVGGNYYGAGIGGGTNDFGQNITIAGGNITAIPGGHGTAGIGAGFSQSSPPNTFGGNITITGGIIHTEGGAGLEYSSPFGGGYRSNSGDIKVKPKNGQQIILTVDETEYVIVKETDITDITNNKDLATIRVEEYPYSLYIAEDTGYTYEDGVLDINTAGSYTIKNVDRENAHSDKIVVSAPSGVVDITLDGIMIDVSAGEESPFDITGNCSVNITLADNTNNYLKSGKNHAAIENNSNPLTISCTHSADDNHTCNENCGTLDAVGNTYSAAIGGGFLEDGENITIAGGNITASSDAVNSPGGAGIGGGEFGNGKNITVSGGIINIYNIGHYGAGIGGGTGGSYSNKTGGNAENITISGGDITVKGGSRAAAIGSSDENATASNIIISGGTINATGGSDAAAIGSGRNSTAKNITISGGTITATAGDTSSTSTTNPSAIGCGEGGSANNIKITPNYNEQIVITVDEEETVFFNETDITEIISSVISVKARVEQAKYLKITGDTGYTYKDGVLDITEAGSYTIENIDKENAYNHRIVVSAPNGVVNVTLDGVKLNISGTTESTFDITGACTTNIILADGSDNSLDAGTDRAAIENNSHPVSISCTHAEEIDHECSENCGSLRAVGQRRAAGIGGGQNEAGEYITISGGNITATVTSSLSGAAIGGGNGGVGRYITITGGIIDAYTGADYCTGIGGGYGYGGSYITISGGIVNARGGNWAAGIGGSRNGTGSNITISGGIVNASGGYQGAGIGGGYFGNGTDITISGGDVTVTGGTYASAIGGGAEGTTSNIFASPQTNTEIILTVNETETTFTEKTDITETISGVRSVKLQSTKTYILGDVTLDGQVTNADVVTLAKYIVNKVTLSDEAIAVADFNGDGEIRVADLIKIARSILEA